MVTIPKWWMALEVGSRLRRVSHDGDKLVHVIAVYEDDGRRFVVTKEWWSGKQCWHHEVQDDIKALVGAIYPDGDTRPE